MNLRIWCGQICFAIGVDIAAGGGFRAGFASVFMLAGLNVAYRWNDDRKTSATAGERS